MRDRRASSDGDHQRPAARVRPARGDRLRPRGCRGTLRHGVLRLGRGVRPVSGRGGSPAGEGGTGDPADRGRGALRLLCAEDPRSARGGGRRGQERGRPRARPGEAGAVTTAGEHVLPGLLASFRTRHRDVGLHLNVDARDVVWPMLGNHEVDLVVAGRPPADVPGRVRALCRNTLVVVGAPHDRTGFVPHRATWLMREPGSGTRATCHTLLSALRPSLRSSPSDPTERWSPPPSRAWASPWCPSRPLRRTCVLDGWR